jgi:hypothetical protein
MPNCTSTSRDRLCNYFFNQNLQTMQNVHYDAPAFPPQVAQDNLGRLVAPIPGLSKLEYFSLQLLPHYLELASTKKLSKNGDMLTPAQAAIIMAQELLDELKKLNTNEKDTLQIIE